MLDYVAWRLETCCHWIGILFGEVWTRLLVGDMSSHIVIGEVWRLESVRRGVSRAAFRPGLSSDMLAAGGGLG